MTAKTSISTKLIALALLSLVLSPPVNAQDAAKRQRGWDYQQVSRWLTEQARSGSTGVLDDDCPDFATRRDVIMNGNRITSQIQNFGSISSPGNTITDIVWNSLGYGYEFGPFVAAEIVDEGRQDPKSVQLFDDEGNAVLDENGDPVYVMHIVSDGLTSNGGETSPDGREWWGWQPIPCAQPVGSFEGLQVVNPDSNLFQLATPPTTIWTASPIPGRTRGSTKPLRTYVWPGALQQGASNADKELIYFMNDYSNREFVYEPFENDATKKGLGLEVETRIYQWANPLAEDVMFLHLQDHQQE